MGIKQDLKPTLMAVQRVSGHKGKGNVWNVLPANTGVKVLPPGRALRFATGASLLGTALADVFSKGEKLSSALKVCNCCRAHFILQPSHHDLATSSRHELRRPCNLIETK